MRAQDHHLVRSLVEMHELRVLRAVVGWNGSGLPDIARLFEDLRVDLLSIPISEGAPPISPEEDDEVCERTDPKALVDATVEECRLLRFACKKYREDLGALHTALEKAPCDPEKCTYLVTCQTHKLVRSVHSADQPPEE